MPERGASGDFGYRWDDPDPRADEVDYLLTEPGDDQWDDRDVTWNRYPAAAATDDRFDAFNTNTWQFKPAPVPWYRTRPAVIAMAAAAIAAIAIVVSSVLLVFSGGSGSPGDQNAPTTPPTPSSALPSPSPTSEPPPPPPPPPPPSSEPPPASQAPVYRPAPPRTTKRPEIGVTRTPVTRSPISVAPQPRTGQ